MCNAHEMAKEFAKENKTPEERVMEHQRKTITRQAAEICKVENERDEWRRTAKAASWLAAFEAGVILILLCAVLGLMK